MFFFRFPRAFAAGCAATLAVCAFAQPALTKPADPKKTSTTDDDIVTLEKFVVTEMKSFSDQAIPGKTPIAFSELGKDAIADELGSRDIPLVLNSTPSVYATNDGGGAGDARVNVRGFDQRNVSILINGVPTNDMENGWLYWSNWDGLGDVTAAIQVQRGLSNVTLPTPSIGGTMNVITDPAAMRRGISVKVEGGYDDFKKVTGVVSTGLLADKFALTLGGVAKTGDEANSVRGTWTEGYGYYIGALYKVNARNRLEFFAIGAPQRHGQRSFASNIAAYDTDYARELGYTDADITGAAAKGAVGAGRDFNPNYNTVSSSYSGLQWWNGETHVRNRGDWLNERENYFHKPQMNLNWYSTIAEGLKLATVFYYSGGTGGGSGTMTNGSSAFAYDPSGAINWDKTIAANVGTKRTNGTTTKTAGQSVGILRNSVNEQDQFGIVSKLSYELTPAIKLTTGLDWRTYTADHFQEVRDLLGGDYYLATSAQASAFWADGTATKLGLGDKVGYYYKSDVDSLGGFVQAQYEQGPWTGFAVYGASTTDYGYTNYFFKDTAGNAVELNPGSFTGHQLKGGVSYELTSQWSVFSNLGWVSKPPAFSAAINTYSGELPESTENEKFSSIEAGVRWKSADRKFNLSANYYYTMWRDRSVNSFSSSYIYYNQGIDANYAGFELEGAYQPVSWMRFDLAASLARAVYTSDGSYYRYNETTNTIDSTGHLYIDGLRVGDAPQSQVAAAVTFYPVRGLSVKLQGRHYDRYWADFEPSSRTSATDKGQSWRIPSYSVFDLHVNYRLPLKTDAFEVTTFLHVFNLLDEVYVSDATDNSSYEGISGAASHTAQRAEVFFGAPLGANVGVRMKF